MLFQNILQKLIITPVLSFKKKKKKTQLTRSRAEAQVLQVKSCFISLHYQETGSCFQENAFHAVVLLKGVSTCLWQEFQGGTYSQIWESEATTLFKELNEQKLFIQTKLSA